MNKYAVFVGLLGIFALSSCKIDKICPAYQSYYLLDETTQNQTFAYIDDDNLPRRDNAPLSAKNDNGLLLTDWITSRDEEIKSIPMQVVYPVVDDSLAFLGDEMMYAETDVIDTLALDSARAAAGSFRYNNDQKFYNWYFREKLVFKSDLLEANQTGGVNQPALSQPDTTSQVPFFQRIFGTPEEKAAKKAEKQAAKEAKAAEKASAKEPDANEEENPDDGF